MITLGIELSTQQGSVALFKDGELLAEKTWLGERVRHGVLFQTLETLLAETELSYGDISFYAVGRGPGSFSGMRMGFATAQALALPDKTEVRAVSSGAALALAAARETGAEQIAVVGDARRGQVWFGLWSSVAMGPVEWSLVPYGEIKIPVGIPAVSPDAERLREYLPQLGGPCFPHAKEVAELALKQVEPEPLEPLYMHPPVFVQPKYA